LLRPAPLRVKSTAGEVRLAGSFSVGLFPNMACKFPRTLLSSFHASGSSKPRGLAGGQKCRALVFPGMLPAAMSVQDTEFRLVWRGIHPDDRVVCHRLAGDRQPLFPLAWGLLGSW